MLKMLSQETPNWNKNNFSCFNNSISCDDSLNEIMKNMNNPNLSKIVSFCMLILKDINNLIEKVKTKNLNFITDFYTIKQSLMFYRPVHLSDDRFLDDLLES